MVTEESPVVMGHEGCGIVQAIGEAVTNVQPGDLVAIEPIGACHVCQPCKTGQHNHCLNMQFAGDPQMRHGLLTKYFKLSEEYCWRIPKGTIAAEEVALIEPLSVAVHTVSDAGVKPGSSVVVFGAGTIGVLCAAVAREFGASQVVCVDINEKKLDFAREFLSTPTFKPETFTPSRNDSPEEDARNVVETFLPDDGDTKHRRGFDVAIEAAGAPPCVQMGIFALRVKGSFIVAGIGQREVSCPILDLVKKELKVQGSFLYCAADFELARSLAVRGKVNLGSLITKVYGFEQVVDAWEAIRKGDGMKLLIKGVD